MKLSFTRTIRTAASERFLVQRDSFDIGALDVHYSDSGRTQVTLILFDTAEIKDDEVPAILTTIDEVLFPDATMDDQSLTFTVVVGRVVGAFTPDHSERRNHQQEERG